MPTLIEELATSLDDVLDWYPPLENGDGWDGIEGAVKKIAAAAVARRMDRVASTLSMYVGYADDFCQSPIEKVFYAAWSVLLEEFKSESPSGGRGGVRCSSPAADDIPPFDHPELLEWHEDVLQYDLFKPQLKIDKFRVDFCLQRFNREWRSDQFARSRKLVVECDGHNFHERTPDQAQKDKSRDRALNAAGYTVIRFTGRELWNDPAKCVEEVDELLSSMIGESLRDQRRAAEGVTR